MMQCELTADGLDSKGYGRRWWNGKRVKSHRLRFFEVFGWWPPVVRHTCDTPACVNPWHLLPGTIADNNRDARERGLAGYVSNWPMALNEGMPPHGTRAYRQERRRRQRAGTWVYR